jgi:hypothetical protein
MRQVPLQYVSKTLHAKFDHITEEPLPERWVELIHYLNEIERQQEQMLRGFSAEQGGSGGKK